MLTPVSLLLSVLVGLLSLLLPIVGAYLLHRAMHPPERRVEITIVGVHSPMHGEERRVQALRGNGEGASPSPEVLTETCVLPWYERLREPAVWGPLALGAVLLLLPLIGRPLIGVFYPAGSDEPKSLQGEVHTLQRGDGTTIHAQVFGQRVRPSSSSPTDGAPMKQSGTTLRRS